MKQLHTVSLKLWMPLLVASTFIALWLFMVWGEYRNLESDLVRYKERFVMQDLASFQREMEKEFRKNHSMEAEQSLASRALITSYDFIVALDNEGIILYSTDRSAVGKHIDEITSAYDRALVEKAHRQNRSDVRISDDTQNITAYFPLTLPGTVDETRLSSAGVLFAQYGLDSDKQHIWSLVWQSLVPTGILLIAVMLIIISLLHRYISRPVGRIIKTVDEIAEGVPGRVDDIVGTGEFSHLGSAINDMSSQLELREQQKSEAEHALLKRAEYERRASEISTWLVQLSFDELEVGIDRALEMLAQQTSADRAYILLFTENSKSIELCHEWCADGIDAQCANPYDMEIDKELPWLNDCIRDEKIFNTADVSMLPETKHLERDLLQRRNIKSMLIVPIKTGLGQVGVIGFDSIKNYSDWSGPEEVLLRLVGQTLAHFIERVRTEKALNVNERRYRDLIETTATAAWEYDVVSGRFTYFSPQIEKMTGYPPEEWTDFESWTQRIHADDRERAVLYCSKEIAKNADHSIEYRMLTADNRVLWIRDEVGVIVEQGKPVTLRGFFIDITELKQAEETIRRAQKMDAIGQLTGGIAHDFNNILGIILGNIHLLEYRKELNEKDKARVNNIKHSAQRAVDLTKQLLGFSRNKATRVRAIDINRVVRDMDNLVQQSLTPQVEVQHYLAKDLWHTDINPGEFEDTLLNLVLNARDAMDGSGKLSIETSNCVLDESYSILNPDVSAGDYVQLSISDNGRGMTPEMQERIFEPFFTTKEHGKGTGLGLAMVFGFVKRSSGNIKVYSEPDIGTTFRVYLPRSESERNMGEINEDDVDYLLPGKETILVVDDEAALTDLVRESLEHLGYEVLTANDAAQALDVLEQSHNIDLLFSDVVMPGGINGYELAEQAVNNHPDLKVLLTSGYTEMAAARNGQARFNANLLSKPYTQVDLTQRIRDILSGSDSRQSEQISEEVGEH